ncbi:hypothetical protein [Microbacterium aurum]
MLVLTLTACAANTDSGSDLQSVAADSPDEEGLIDQSGDTDTDEGVRFESRCGDFAELTLERAAAGGEQWVETGIPAAAPAGVPEPSCAFELPPGGSEDYSERHVMFYLLAGPELKSSVEDALAAAGYVLGPDQIIWELAGAGGAPERNAAAIYVDTENWKFSGMSTDDATREYFAAAGGPYLALHLNGY